MCSATEARDRKPCSVWSSGILALSHAEEESGKTQTEKCASDMATLVIGGFEKVTSVELWGQKSDSLGLKRE